MGNKASVAVNHGKSIQYTKKSIRANNKRKNNKSNPLKCEFEYNHNHINETMVEAGAVTHDVNDLRYWVPTQLTPSKILLLTSSLCPCPEPPPPSHTDVKTNSSIISTSPGDENRPSQEEGSRAIHNNNYDRFMTPFSFKRSRGRDRGVTHHHHQQQRTADSGESHQLSNKQCQNFTSCSGYTTATTVPSQDLLPRQLLEGGDPTHLPDADPDPIRTKIKNMQKTNQKYKPAWMPEVKESSAETNLSKMMKRSSKSIFTDSKSSYTNVSLKTKSTKLSFGAKLKNSILRTRFKKFRSSSMTTNAPKRDNTNLSSTAKTTTTTTSHGSRAFSDDAKTKNLRSLVNVKSPESLQKGMITSDTVIIHKLPKSVDSLGSMYRKKSNFSTVGGSDEGLPLGNITPKTVKSSPVGDKETTPNKRDGGDRGSSSSRGSSPTRKGGPGMKSKGKNFGYLKSNQGRPAAALNPIPIRKGQRVGKKRPPPPPVFIGNYGCGGGCSSSVRKSQNPADRLKNVDIVEELVYNCPDGGGGCGCGVDCCSCNPDCDYYSCCNECGECQPVSQPCSCGNNGSQGNPVKYCRRQRFNFGDERNGDNCSDGPPFTWQGARPCNPYDEVPVGKNPTCNDASMDGSNDCNALPSESGTYFFDAERRCFAKVIEVKNPDVAEPEIMDEIIDEEPILTNIEPIIQPVIRPTNQMCGGGGGGPGGGMAPMPFVGTLGQQQGNMQNPMGHLSPPSDGKSHSKSGKKGKLKSGGGSNTNNNQGATDGYGNDYGGNLGLMGLSGMNMPGLTAMGPYGTIAMPQYQYNAPPPIRPVPPNHPVGPGPPHPAHAPYPPAPPGQPACCGPTCFPGYPSTNYPPYNPYFTGPGGDYRGRRGKKDKNKKSKKDKKKKKGKNNSSQVHGSKSVQTNYSYDDDDE